MKIAKSIVAVALVIVLGVGPVLAFAKAKEGTRASVLLHQEDEACRKTAAFGAETSPDTGVE